MAHPSAISLLQYDRHGTVLEPSPESAGWSAARQVGEACALLARHPAVGIPSEYVGLVPRDKPTRIEHVLHRDEPLHQYGEVGLSVVDRRALMIEQRLPHIGVSARTDLLRRLKLLEPGELVVDTRPYWEEQK